jgi:hypothetical protein
MERKTLLVLCLSFLLFGAGPSVAFAASDNPPCPPFQCTSTQGGSNNDCNNNPGCTDTKQNPGGNNKTCTGPDNKCG